MGKVLEFIYLFIFLYAGKTQRFMQLFLSRCIFILILEPNYYILLHGTVLHWRKIMADLQMTLKQLFVVKIDNKSD